MVRSNKKHNSMAGLTHKALLSTGMGFGVGSCNSDTNIIVLVHKAFLRPGLGFRVRSRNNPNNILELIHKALLSNGTSGGKR